MSGSDDRGGSRDRPPAGAAMAVRATVAGAVIAATADRATAAKATVPVPPVAAVMTVEPWRARRPCPRPTVRRPPTVGESEFRSELA
jgi:hypothetical protein